MSSRFRIVAIVALLALAGFAVTTTACACARAHRDGEPSDQEPSDQEPTVEPRFNGDYKCPADNPDCRFGSLDRLRAGEQAARAAEREAAEASQQ